MSDKYKIGVDIKFLQNAAVVMMCEPSVYPDREELLQMVGRGNRAGGNYIGMVFTHDKTGSEEDIEELIKKNSNLEFKNAAAVFRLLELNQASVPTMGSTSKK